MKVLGRSVRTSKLLLNLLWTIGTNITAFLVCKEEKKLVIIQLQKAKAHESWVSIIKGQDEVDAMTKESMDKKMLLEKFQRDYPGFDFSGAELTGQLPADPATYLHPSTFENK